MSIVRSVHSELFASFDVPLSTMVQTKKSIDNTFGIITTYLQEKMYRNIYLFWDLSAYLTSHEE